MAWIESHQSLGTHLKLRRLARELRVHRAQAIGHLHFLWWWALDNAPTGDLSALAPAEIAEVAEWPGPEDVFVAALKSCGWLEESGQIHDWEDYAGRILVERARDRERKRAERARTLLSRPPDVHRTSDGHPQDVTPENTGVRAYPTQPNPTIEEHTPRGREDVPVEMPTGFPKTEDEAKAACAIVGCPDQFAVDEYHRAKGRGGRDGRDVPVRSWASYLRTCWTHHQGRKAEEAARPPRTSSRTIGTSTPDHASF